MTSHKINIGKAVYSVKQHENGTFTAHNCSTLREVKSENTMRKIFKALAERDHAEALQEYDARNTLYVYAPGDAAREVWDQMTPIEQTVSVEMRHAEALEMNRLFNMRAASGDRPQRLAKETGLPVLTCLKELIAEEGDYFAALERLRQIVSDAHSEALEINAAIDSMIAARQHIANKKTDFSQETWDLVRLGNSYKEAGREWYRWAKATALRLWESSLAQRQRLQAQ